MRHLILFFIIILGFLLIKCLPIESFSNTNISNDKYSILATKNYKKGDKFEAKIQISATKNIKEGDELIFTYNNA